MSVSGRKYSRLRMLTSRPIPRRWRASGGFCKLVELASCKTLANRPPGNNLATEGIRQCKQLIPHCYCSTTASQLLRQKLWLHWCRV